MSIQLALPLDTRPLTRRPADGRKLSRKSDPRTSVQAAQRALVFKGSHESKIFGVLYSAGEHGATMKEIAGALGMEPVQIGRRLGNMEERKLITRRLRKDSVKPKDYEQRAGCAVWWRA